MTYLSRRFTGGALVGTLLISTLATVGSAAPGVARRVIKIGMHASMTGASPLPSQSLEQASDIYWRWRRQHRQPINGRHVSVVLENDNYNPVQAVAVCKEMVEEDKVFMLSGVLTPEGKDQVQSCARYAASVGVPYVSLGQTKMRLRRLRSYFTLSMSWPEQARLLADYFVDRLEARHETNALVRFNSPNYQDSRDAFVDEMRKRRTTIDFERAVSHNAGQAEAQAVVQAMQAQDVENVFVLVSPVWFLQLMKAADTADYHPKWTSIGMTISSHDTVARTGCNGKGAIDGTKVLSPLPAFRDRNRFDKRYARAMQRFYSEPGNMVSWLGWATSRQLAKLLKRPGRHLTRKRFIRNTERAKHVRTGIMPALRFTRRDHFGGEAIHVLTARCRTQQWHTTARFKRNF